MKIPVAKRTVSPPGGNQRNLELATAEGRAITETAGAIDRVLFAVEEKKIKARQALETANAQAQASQGFSRALDEARKIQDPDEYDLFLNQQWENVLDEVKTNLSDDTLKKLEPDLILLDSKNKLTIQAQSLKKLHDSTLATADSALNSMGNSALTGTIKNTHEMIKSGEKVIDSLVDAGVISTEDQVKQKRLFKEQTYWNRFLVEVQKDPFKISPEVPWLTEEQKIKAREIVDREREALKRQFSQATAEADTIRMVQERLDAGIPFDHKATDDKKAVDLYYNKFLLPSLQGLPHDEQKDQIVRFSAKAGMVPTALQSQLRGGLVAGEPLLAADMADTVDRLQNQAGAVLDTMSDNDLAFAKITNQFTNAGVGEQSAVKLARDVTYNLNPEVKKTLASRYREEKFNEKNIGELKGQSFVENFFGRAAKIPVQLESDYNSLVEAFYLKSGGDIDIARSLANDKIKLRWGQTKIGGPRRMTRLPPEQVYRIQGIGSGWIKDQWNEGVEEIIKNMDATQKRAIESALGRVLDVDDIRLTSDSITEREAIPSYGLTLPDGNPVFNETGQLIRFTPDFKSSPAFDELKAKLEKQKSKWREDRKNFTLMRENPQREVAEGLGLMAPFELQLSEGL